MAEVVTHPDTEVQVEPVAEETVTTATTTTQDKTRQDSHHTMQESIRAQLMTPRMNRSFTMFKENMRVEMIQQRSQRQERHMQQMKNHGCIRVDSSHIH